MELVYLWVEEYKNIENQGFNFSPRFECSYDKDTEELTINENKNYVNIFPKNINVTAIVGENGSGKSNLLDLIDNQGYENPYAKHPRMFMELNNVRIYFNKKENTFYIFIKNIDLKINNKTKMNIKEEKNNDTLEKIYIKSKPTHKQKEYLSFLRMLKNSSITFPFDIPGIVNFGIHDDFYELFKLIENDEFDFYTLYSPFLENIENRFKIFHIILLLSYITNQEIPFNVKASKHYDTTILELEKTISLPQRKKIYEILNLLKDNLEAISEVPDHYIKIKNISKDFIKNYIEILRKKNKNQLFEFKGNNTFYFNFYPKMSEGQYQLTYLFNELYNGIIDENIILLIDEVENFLHPNWQKNYLNYIFKFIEKNFKDKSIHIILTAHSPFILSDLPKENVLFLKNGKQEYPFKNDEQTFGANIHTLLSHGFFMEDGLMGEFAKSKIETIKNFYDVIQKLKSRIEQNSKTKELCKKSFEKRKEKFKNIQKIIGEPFLKTVIKNYLDELEIIFYGKKEFLKNEIKRLQDLEKSLDA